MTGPMPQEDPILEKARQLRQAGASIQEVEQYLNAKGYRPPTAEPGRPSVPSVRPDVSRALSRNRPDVSGDFEVIGGALAANAANLAQGIPGMEAAEAGISSLVNRQPYQKTLQQIREATGGIPAPLRVGERIAGALPLAASLPMSNALQAAGSGAGLGAADVLGSADPLSDYSIGERSRDALIAGGLGGVLGGAMYGAGKLAQKGRELYRTTKAVKEAPTLGARAVATTKNLTKTDAENFGKVAQEAEATPTTPGVQDVLQRPKVAKYASQSSGNDTQKAIDAYQLMSAERTDIRNKANVSGWTKKLRARDHTLQQEQAAIKEALGSTSVKPPIMLDIAGETSVVPGKPFTTMEIPPERKMAAPGEMVPEAYSPPRTEYGKGRPRIEIETPAMQIQTAPAEEVPAPVPSFGPANQASADIRRMRAIGEKGANFAQKLMAGPSGKAELARKESPEAIEEWVKTLSPDEAKEALQSVLAIGKRGLGVRIPAQTGLVGGVRQAVQPGIKMNRLTPFIDQLKRQAGQRVANPLNLNAVMRGTSGLNAAIANPED